jgi:protein-S-isoprenylcysteine O-methyltransferase Ste14
MRRAQLFAWGGGALFVASLAYCMWWYLARLGVDRPFAGWPAIVADAALITLFASHHSVFAREAVKRRLQPLVGGRLRSVYVCVASVLLFIVCIAWRPIGATLFDVRGAAAVACAVVQLTGVALIAWSVARIDPLELAGIRPAPAPRPGSGQADALQIGGPYRIVRHPLYLGWMLAAFASPHLTGDRFAFALLTSLYLMIAVRWEERSLRLAFGDAYATYAAQVPWRVIPFIY